MKLIQPATSIAALLFVFTACKKRGFADTEGQEALKRVSIAEATSIDELFTNIEIKKAGAAAKIIIPKNDDNFLGGATVSSGVALVATARWAPIGLALTQATAVGGLALLAVGPFQAALNLNQIWEARALSEKWQAMFGEEGKLVLALMKSHDATVKLGTDKTFSDWKELNNRYADLEKEINALTLTQLTGFLDVLKQGIPFVPLYFPENETSTAERYKASLFLIAYQQARLLRLALAVSLGSEEDVESASRFMCSIQYQCGKETKGRTEMQAAANGKAIYRQAILAPVFNNGEDKETRPWTCLPAGKVNKIMPLSELDKFLGEIPEAPRQNIVRELSESCGDSKLTHIALRGSGLLLAP